jgi:hypothetical protein
LIALRHVEAERSIPFAAHAFRLLRPTLASTSRDATFADTAFEIM